MRTCLLILLLSALAFADVGGPLAPFSFNGRRFQSNIESYPNMLRALESGFPMFAVLEGEDKDSAWKGAGKDFAETAQNARENLAKMETGYFTSLQETANRRRARLSPAKAVADLPPITAPPAVAPVFAWADFCKCAPPALAALKLKRRMQLLSPGFDLFEVESALATDRGDGSAVKPDGLACGRHLGAYGYREGSAANEVATLAALSLPLEKAGFARLARYFFLYRASLDGKTQLPYVWQFAWQRARFARLVRNAAPPELAEILRSYAAYSRVEVQHEQSSLRVEVDEKSLAAQAEADWNNLKLPEMKSCAP